MLLHVPLVLKQQVYYIMFKWVLVKRLKTFYIKILSLPLMAFYHLHGGNNIQTSKNRFTEDDTNNI